MLYFCTWDFYIIQTNDVIKQWFLKAAPQTSVSSAPEEGLYKKQRPRLRYTEESGSPEPLFLAKLS